MKSRHLILLFIIQLFFVTKLVSQTKVISVEKSLSKQFLSDDKTIIQLNANKADIKIIPSADENIYFTALLSSKHENKSIAEEDLKKQKIIAKKNGNTISILNYVEISNNEIKPSSDLHVYYTIKIPKANLKELKINNNFGIITVKDIDVNSSIESKFCSINISDFEGNFKLKSNYDNISIKDIKAFLDINLIHTSLRILNQFGDLKIRSKFSSLILKDINPISISDINDDHSEINLFQSCISCFHYLLDLNKSTFDFPFNDKVNYEIEEKNQITGSIYKPKQTQIIKIKSQTSIISIKQLTK
jgi:hypothetical protein